MSRTPMMIRTPGARLMRGASTLALMAFLAGCHAAHVTKSGFPNDYRDRHPIRFVEGENVHEVLIGSGRGLSPVQRAEVSAVAGQWRRRGSGAMTIDVPAGTANEIAAGQAAREVHATLAAAGVPRHAVLMRAYQPEGRSTLAPIRVSYATVKAEAGPCGLWPDDLGAQDWKHQIENRPYWNFGCATQRNLAAMVDNPQDLIQPRSETPPYAPRRQTVVDRYRQGQDPSTQYNQESAAKVSNVGQ